MTVAAKRLGSRFDDPLARARAEAERRVYCAVQPPSIVSEAPFTNEASGVQR